MLVMLGQDSGQERMDSMKSWTQKKGRVCCVMQSVSHVLWDCANIFMLELRRELYKRMVRGQEGEYNKLRREVKDLVMEKGVVEKANADFEAWSFVERVEREH